MFFEHTNLHLFQLNQEYISDALGKSPDFNFENIILSLNEISKDPVLGGEEFPVIFTFFLKDKIIFDTRSNSGL